MAKQLTQKQLSALPLLAGGLAGSETAKLVGVKASTVSEWRNHCPAFSTELDRLREKVSQEAMADLQSNVVLATSEIRRLITTSTSDAVRLKACEFVITNFGLPKPTASNALIEAPGKIFNLALVLEGLGVSHAP